MDSNQTASGNERSLRIILPELYHFITTELENRYNIHKYDIQANAIKEESGYKVILYYGDGFAHQMSRSLTNDVLHNKREALTEFLEEAGESCKEVMIADYFRMMKP
ncbi:hypothetical protein GCM10008983_22580 [Lentibacillus halophilus]|uniref:Uncharacterized protein n=1 Tax=Lentibacillus halophilus TaxID=295065 RepID=A0ABN0ZDY2_9BACI